MFEQAAKLKLRFDAPQGRLATEDLYELNLNALDAIARKVNAQLREEEVESFIPTSVKRKTATNNDLRLDILKHVI
jgi:hypothetical protein